GIVGRLRETDREVGLVVVTDHVERHRKDHLVDAGGIDGGEPRLGLPPLKHLLEGGRRLALGTELPVSDAQSVVTEGTTMIVMVEKVLGALVGVKVDEHRWSSSGPGWAVLNFAYETLLVKSVYLTVGCLQAAREERGPKCAM